MDKTVKIRLKEAREAINNKNVALAEILCREILAQDENNYMGLVILAASLQDCDKKWEIPNLLKKAASNDPSQLPAWKGLAAYYEKNHAVQFHVEDVENAYNHLLSKETNFQKWKEIAERAAKTFEKYGEEKKVIQFFTPYLRDKNFDFKNVVVDILLQSFSHFKIIPNDLIKTYEDLLERKISSESANVNLKLIEYLKKYLDLLKGEKKHRLFLEQCERVLEIYPLDPCIVEIMCEVYCESYTTGDDYVFADWSDKIGKLAEHLLESTEQCVWASLASGLVAMNQNDYISARAFFESIQDDCWQKFLFLGETMMAVKCYDAAAESFFRLESNEVVKEKMEGLLLECLSRSNSEKNSIMCLEKCFKMAGFDKNCHILSHMIHSLCTLKRFEEAGEYLDKMKAVGKSADVDFHFNLVKFHENAANSIIPLTAFVANDGNWKLDALILLGLAHWGNGDFSKAAATYLQVVKLAPFIFPAFLHLGRYYNLAGNLDKARKCCEKANRIYDKSEECYRELDQIYGKLEMQAERLEMLDKITKDFGKGWSWAWLKLGICLNIDGNYDKAVESSRMAIRLNSKDCLCWEILGESYLAKGSYMAAMKCFEKCVEFDSENLHAKLQMANIKRYIGLLDESVSDLRSLTVSNADNVLALTGFAHSCYLRAKEYYIVQDFNDCKDLCTEAAVAVFQVLASNNKLACAWKMLADICFLCYEIPQSTRLDFLIFPAIEMEKWHKRVCYTDDKSHVILSRRNLLRFGAKCYSIVAQLNEEKGVSHYAWHDSALCYYSRMRSAQKRGKIALAEQLANFAATCAKKAVSSCLSSFQHWNLLGVIYATYPNGTLALAQHCFIKAIECGKNCAIPWSNLGTLYYEFWNSQEDIVLANAAYKMAQSEDNEFPYCWIGQSLIAKEVNHAETLELFYHAAMMCYHEESARGLSYLLCHTLQIWEQGESPARLEMIDQAVQVAVDVLKHYTVHYPRDVACLNNLAVLLERENKVDDAFTYLERALEESRGKSTVIVKNAIRIGRKCRKYQLVMKLYEENFETETAMDLNYAIALHKSGLCEKALEIFEAVSNVRNEISQQIYVIMGFLEKKKSYFEGICKSENGSAEAAIAAAAYLISNTPEDKLCSDMLQHLQKFEMEKKYICDISFLHVYKIYKNDISRAIMCLTKYVSVYRGNMELLAQLGWLMVKNEDIEMALIMVENAVKGPCHSKNKNIYSLLAFCYLSLRNAKAVEIATKAVSLWPECAEHRALLLAACLMFGHEGEYDLKDVGEKAMHMASCSQELKEWIEKVLLVISK